MTGEKESRFLSGRYDYKITVNANEEDKQEIIARMKEIGIPHRHVVVESVTSAEPTAFIFQLANLAVPALTLLYTIYKDRKKKDNDINITFWFPNFTTINLDRPEDFEAVLQKLKQIGPQWDEEERKKVMEHFKQLYKQTFKEDIDS